MFVTHRHLLLAVALLVGNPISAATISCGTIDATYGIYSTSNLVIGDDVVMNGNNVSQGSTTGDVGVATNGTITSSSITIPAHIPATFPANGSSTNANENDSPIAASSAVFYDQITVGSDDNLTFTGEGPFHIKRLTLGEDASVHFSSGTYYIDELILNDESRIYIDSAPVALHIGTQLLFAEEKIEVNNNSGANPEDLLIFLHTDATISANHRRIKIRAAIIGVGNGTIEFGGDELEFQGIIQSENDVIIGEEAEFTLTSAQQTAIANACSGGSAALDHFSLSHDGNGINCVSEAISVTAKDSSDAVIDSFAESVTLNTQSSKGTWSLTSGNGTFSDSTPNDGIAVYTFDDLDNGIASFSLSYQEGNATLDVDVFLTSNTSIRDDDAESSLVFSPSGFTFTQSALANPPPSPINDPMTTQTAGTNFNLHIAAFGQTPDDPICGVIEAYTGAKSVAFWFDYENPASGTLVATVDASPIATSEGAASGQTVTFTNGQASIVAKYKDVGQIQMHGKDGTIAGASNAFVVRPSTIVILPIAGNPAASSAIGSGFVAAGEAFTVLLEVRDAEGSRTPNFGNETVSEGLMIIASSLVIPAAGGRNGSNNDGVIANSTSFSATSPAGTFISNTVSWDEYGIIKLQPSISDADYLGTGNITGSESGNVGRFYPANYTLATSSVLGACNGITYMDQPALTLNYDLQARGTAGNVLFNYDLGLLGAPGVAIPQFHAEDNNQGNDLIARMPLTSVNWALGQYQLSSSSEQFIRDSSPDGPYATLQLGISVIDGLDGQQIANPDMNAATSTDCIAAANCNARRLGSTTAMRYGRWEVMNSFGPETAPLDVKMKTSYFGTTGNFVSNVDDTCTLYNNTGAALSNYQGSVPGLTVTSPTGTNYFVNGQTPPGATIVLSAPGVSNGGSVDVTYDAPAWLEYDWNGGGDEDPYGIASFGHYRGHDRVIYWREVLN